MAENDLRLHKVQRPRMWVFTTDYLQSMEWPKQLTHNDQTYHYVSNEVMPAFARDVAGYALYEIKDYVQRPITHREFGSFMGAISQLMMQQHVSMEDAIANGDPFVRSYIANSIDFDPIRAAYIIENCKQMLSTAKVFTIKDHSPEELAHFAKHNK
jgi:hypothetical protein